ncbi:MAG: aconitate hydratase AcnA [Anaerolineales bacterium]|nr:aconitate hydratase AcnA [Anaerolineales bacterium]
MRADPFGARRQISTSAGPATIFHLPALGRAGLTDLDRLPYTIRVLLETLLRQVNGREITEQDVLSLAAWQAHSQNRPEVPFLPARVLMQDFTGVPAIVDLAAMRAALARLGGDPRKINPRVPVDLVIDHSVQVDFFASPEALRRNAELEFQRNRERFEFLRWGEQRLEHLRVVPPATGIVHQVNLEYLASVVHAVQAEGEVVLLPDTVVGTDSHTTMVNGLGVLGWGVGGIEAEAVMLGQPIVMAAPDVVGVHLAGALPEGTTATDLVLTVTQQLRAYGVVDKFVEFFGPGVASLPLPDRATLANMAPEYGATVGFFPVDDETLRYLRLTGRPEELLDRVERYTKEQGLFAGPGSPPPEFTHVLRLDLASVEPSLAGPKRPQDRVPLSDLQQQFRSALQAPTSSDGYGLPPQSLDQKATVGSNGSKSEIGHGAVVIAAITSCTNTSNPSVMIAAGLLARNAAARGLSPKPYVKTSLAPGSRVVTEYLEQAGLMEPLAQLGFNVVGYGCTTCIGNSGPLPGEVIRAINESGLVTTAVLSGNRNFEGRINPHVRASYLASPPLVVAYALAGTTDIDLRRQPLGSGSDNLPVYLRDIWPSQAEVQQVLQAALKPELFRQRYAEVFTGNPAWNALPAPGGDLFPWSPDSTYIQEPPFFQDFPLQASEPASILGARVLLQLGDSVTTDHISPAGAIQADSPAGMFLIEHKVQPRDFNSFGARRGNDRLMTRGTFGNIHLKNLLVPGTEGGVTVHFPDGERMSIFQASLRYRSEGLPLLLLAGKEYGTGSSRDWAAKGPALLGVRAVLAESYERIHRSNLVGMGLLPLQFLPGQSAQSLGLTGSEVFDLVLPESGLQPGGEIRVRAAASDRTEIAFAVRVRIDTPIELDYYRHGGVLHMVLRNLLQPSADSPP